MKLLERHEDPPLTLSVVDCNIPDCLGSGYCNIGCAWGRKLSALDWTLPEAQRKHPDAVRVLPDCQVLKVGQGRKVEARIDGRRVTVQAREAVVLSAGALASSVILQRSGLGGDRVGRGLVVQRRVAGDARLRRTTCTPSAAPRSRTTTSTTA